MVAEHYQSTTADGVAAICQDWFDEPCPLRVAGMVAENAQAKRPYFSETTLGGIIVWLKSRLMERGVLRAMAVELGLHDGTPRLPEIPTNANEEERERIYREWKESMVAKFAPINLDFSRSNLAASPLMLSPIDRVANRVAHFEDDRPCPYCRKYFRNGAALRLHVIDFHSP